ncbi:MAG: peptidoglycan-binding protein [Geminicoccaceae bacterium]
MRRSLYLGTLMLLATATAAAAADAQNRFQAYGLGRTTCKAFVEICESKKEACKLTGTWMEGYFSAFNALSRDTFDILPWQPPELMAQFTFNVCKQNPDAPVLEVVNELIRRLLVPNRVQAASDRVKIGDGDQAVMLYRDTIRDIQEQLDKTGHLDGKADGSFGPGTKSAVEAFQKAAGLKPTGIPDQRTLIALFYGSPQQEGQAQQQRRPRTAPAGAPQVPAAQAPAKLDLNLGPAPAQ